MRNRGRVLFLVSSVLAAASFLGAQCFTPPPQGGMLGPHAPAVLDTDGSGDPSQCDTPIVPLYDSLADRITIPNPFEDCNKSGALHDQFFLLRNGSGTPTEIYRDRGDQTEILTPTGFFTPNQPLSGHLDIQKLGSTVKSGDGSLVPGGPEYFTGVTGGQTLGGNVSATMSFVYKGTDGNGNPAYISLPWSQLAALGVLGNNCNTDVPQVFIPLSNRKIVLDLNGDGVPDPIFFSSPPLAPPVRVTAGIPTVSRGVMALLAAALVGAGLLQLRRGGLGF
jgi:hypothetical protein